MTDDGWARDGAVLGGALPALVVAPPSLLIRAMFGEEVPVELWLSVAAATPVGLVGGAALGAALREASRAAPRAAWWLGLPAGLVAGCVASVTGMAAITMLGGHLDPPTPLVFGAIAACTLVVGPVHPLYLAVRRRGRAGWVVLPLALLLGGCLGPLGFFGGLWVGAALR